MASEANPYAQGIFQAVQNAKGLMDDYNKVTDVKSGGLGGDASAENINAYQSKYTDAQAKTLRAQ